MSPTFRGVNSVSLLIATGVLLAGLSARAQQDQRDGALPPPPLLSADVAVPDELPPVPRDAQEQQAQPAVDAAPQSQASAQAVTSDATLEATASPDDAPTVSSTDAFTQPLAPYGDWVIVEGVRVWKPSQTYVGDNFTPYTSDGQWVWSNAGWSFASTLPFAWATYHYGRWWNDTRFGWVWWPDTLWGPSWVDWRWGGGYAGWAPLAPRFWANRYRPNWYFMNSQYFGQPGFRRYGLPRDLYGRAYAATSAIAPRVYGQVSWQRGPQWSDVSRVAVAPPVRVSGASFAPPVRLINSGQASGGWTTRTAPAVSVQPNGTRFAPGVQGGVRSGYSAPPVGSGTQRAMSAPQVNRGAGPQTAPGQSFSAPRVNAPAYQGTPSYNRPSAPPIQAAPNFSRPSGPQYQAAPSVGRPYSYSPQAQSAPRYAAPQISAPHVYSPQMSAPRMSAPQMSAPSFSGGMSAPRMSAPHMSAPSFSGGGRGAAPHVGGHR